MELNVKLEAFEGPLDLLLHLIEKNKVDIYDIPIAVIADQYLDYLEQMDREDLDSMSSFLVMAATLLDIKARMLLPDKEEEEGEEETDPRAELVEQLLQYKMYKYMSMVLKDRQLDAGKVIYRRRHLPEAVVSYEEPLDLEQLTAGYDMNRLHEIFLSVMRRQADKIDPVRSGFGRIRKEEVSIEDRTDFLKKYAAAHHQFSFRNLLQKQHSKAEVIVTFLAVLELMKSGLIAVRQEHLFDDILIESKVPDERRKEADHEPQRV
ncbi:hypothetical protein CXIVA_23300 [Clostridium sp. SY8519]|uniref:segregation and condensation protein A n=1 Tax=Clostridium sp. (strain SY8519) TaxID=1042156 RepID=UPI0002171C0B|nr:segregation/condensation protein A [Clostridium sp. SY8519]BAK48297.1 hypothetical protein CXIVA_23300 [Clostridium sp. SY8519]